MTHAYLGDALGAAVKLWESLLLAGSGGILTLLGTWMGFQLQTREQRRVRSEQITRDNLLRLHTDRVAGYAAFYREAGAMRAALFQLARAQTDSTLIDQVRKQRSVLWHECTVVTLVGSRAAATAAWALLNYATDVAHGKAALDTDQYGKLIWSFVLIARADLLYPDAPDTPRTEVWQVGDSQRQASGTTATAAEAGPSGSEG